MIHLGMYGFARLHQIEMNSSIPSRETPCPRIWAPSRLRGVFASIDLLQKLINFVPFWQLFTGGNSVNEISPWHQTLSFCRSPPFRMNPNCHRVMFIAFATSRQFICRFCSIGCKILSTFSVLMADQSGVHLWHWNLRNWFEQTTLGFFIHSHFHRTPHNFSRAFAAILPFYRKTVSWSVFIL